MTGITAISPLPEMRTAGPASMAQPLFRHEVNPDLPGGTSMG